MIVPLLYGTELLYSANLATFRQVLGNNSSFHKPEAAITDLQSVNFVIILVFTQLTFSLVQVYGSERCCFGG